MLFDSHAHLDDGRFDKDRDNVIKRAKQNNIQYILNPGADLNTSIGAVNLSEKHHMIYQPLECILIAKDMDNDTIEYLKHYQ